MNIQYINRANELKYLNEKYKETNLQIIPIYGRRRIGKTELIKQFCKNKEYIYYLADKGREIDQLKEFTLQIKTHFNDDTLPNSFHFENWIEAFTYIIKKTKKEKLIITIDEFPYLIESNQYIPSIFQKIFDEIIKNSNLFVILCGSSISMMENEVLAYKSPLYGRRTAQMKLDKLKFKDARLFFPQFNIEENIKIFSVLDGIPAYIIKFKENNLLLNIKKNILSKNEFLYLDAEILLKEELREPNMYLSILKAIAYGKTRPNEIGNFIGEQRTVLTRYLTTLERLSFIKKEIPITEKNIHKSKKGIYKIADNYLLFWFKWVYPYKSFIEDDKIDFIINDIKQNFNIHTSFVFEDICKEFVRKKYSENYLKTGRWWHKDKEIDIVALNDSSKQILFCECKWSNNVDAQKILSELKQKAEYVDWNTKKSKISGIQKTQGVFKDTDKRKESYAIFAKSFKDKNVKGVKLYDLIDLERMFM